MFDPTTGIQPGEPGWDQPKTFHPTMMLPASPDAPHQIRLVFTRNCGKIAVSCSCRVSQPNSPIADIADLDEAWRVWWGHVKDCEAALQARP